LSDPFDYVQSINCNATIAIAAIVATRKRKNPQEFLPAGLTYDQLL